MLYIKRVVVNYVKIKVIYVMIGIFKVNSDIFEIVDKRGEDMIKKKKIILFIGIVLFIILSIYMYFFVFSTKELKVKQIDIEDSSYVIENINEDEEFEIYTNDMSYFITDINGKELNTKKRLENHILTITPENGYQKNVIYKLASKQGDSFVDKNLKNIKCIYFSLNLSLIHIFLMLLMVMHVQQGK